MHGLVYEPRHTGHHPMYIRHALKHVQPHLSSLTVVTSKEAPNSQAFRYHVLGEIKIDCFEPVIEALPFHSGRARCSAFFSGLVNAVHRHKPDWTFIPTADDLALYTALHPLDAYKKLKRLGPMQCGLHYSIPRLGLPFSRIAMSVWKAICLRMHGDLHKVCLDPYAVELASENFLLQQDKMVGCPVAPVDCSITNMSRDQSRRILGLPIGKKIIGSTGALSTNPSKGVVELLETLPENDGAFSVLLAGKLSSELRQLIQSRYSEFIDTGQLLLLDRYLSDEELLLAIKSMDISSNLYRKFYATSSIVLYAACLGTPVIAPNSGWFRDFLKDVPIGWLIGKETVTSGQISEFLESTEEKQLGSKVKENLLKYYSPDNFSRCWFEQFGAANSIHVVPGMHWNQWKVESTVSLS